MSGKYLDFVSILLSFFVGNINKISSWFCNTYYIFWLEISLNLLLGVPWNHKMKVA